MGMRRKHDGVREETEEKKIDGRWESSTERSNVPAAVRVLPFIFQGRQKHAER